MTEVRRRISGLLAGCVLAAATGAVPSEKAALAQTTAFPTRSITNRLGSLSGFQVTRDARRAAFIREGTSDALVVRDLDTGADRTLAALPGRKLSDPRWAPDGSRIAFVTRDAATFVSSRGFAHDVRLATLSDGTIRIVAEAAAGESFVDWSPNSLWLAMQVGTLPSAMAGDFRVVDTTTLSERKLYGQSLPTRDFTWSTDSARVSFASMNARYRSEFWIAAVDTGEVQPLAVPFYDRSDLIYLSTAVGGMWTTDGRVAIRHPRAPETSYLVSPDPAETPRIGCVSKAPIECLRRVTPDGRFQVARDTDSKKLLLIDSTNGSTRPVTTASAEETEPVLSRDGRLLAFVSDAGGERALYVTPIDRAPASAPVRLYRLGRATRFGSLGWSADGRLLIDELVDESDIYRINMDRNGHAVGAARRLTQNTIRNGAPSISPDGKAIGYLSEGRLALMTANGASERAVGPTAVAPHVEWLSPEEMLFSGTEYRARGMTIASVNVRSGATRPFVDLGSRTSRWQYVRSRNEVIYSPINENFAGKEIIATSLADQSEKRLVTVTNELGGTATFRISPDGAYIAYDRWVGKADDWSVELHVMTIDGKDDRLLRTTKATPAGYVGGPYDWSPDGRFLLFDGVPDRLMIANVKTGESWPIVEAATNDAVTSDSRERARWSPDGSFIVFTKDIRRHEYRLIEGVRYDAVVGLVRK